MACAAIIPRFRDGRATHAQMTIDLMAKSALRDALRSNRDRYREASVAVWRRAAVEDRKPVRSAIKTNAVASLISELLRSLGEILRNIGEIGVSHLSLSPFYHWRRLCV
jgi:hypothetical protein